MNIYSVVIPDELEIICSNHLIRADSQEDLCFATYKPSTGSKRFSGIISNIIPPTSGDRKVHGNVSFMPQYFERVLRIAEQQGEGVAFMHSHPFPGWQDMSLDDISAEKRMAPATYATTGLPLLGMTIGNDGSWSARFWVKGKAKRAYNLKWCETVRRIGLGLQLSFNDHLMAPSLDAKKQLRTISAWGSKAQSDLSRLRVGIVGVGSVGSIVAEILARTGISYYTLIDFDSVEEKNLDRLTNVFKRDIGRAKVKAIAEGIRRSATSPRIRIDVCEFSICEPEGYKAALNCDVLFSCVDKPWPRQVLNLIAYSHLIPVIDGGILVRTNKTNSIILGADWKVHTVGYKRCCLECSGQYTSEYAALEKSGLLEDQSYIKGIDMAFLNNNQNVFPFSCHLASMEVLQMLSLVVAPQEFSDVGEQIHHFISGNTDVIKLKRCDDNCFFRTILGLGDLTNVEVFGVHKLAEKTRKQRSDYKQELEFK